MLAQQLYEGVDIQKEGSVGLITYMRTDSTRISTIAQDEARKYIINTYGEKYVDDKPRIFKNKSAAQDAHEAIRPTYITMTPEKVKDSLSRDQYRLYKLIWDRFIASQMTSAIYDTLNVDIKADEYLFKASGSKIVFKGFMALYVEGKDDETEDKKDKDPFIPELKEGEVLTLNKIIPTQYFTQPPSRYTEATLVRTLEEKGIGRPSTYSPTISTIISRGYIDKEKKFLFPTELGLIVNKIMEENFTDIININFTAELENKLDKVEEGNKSWKALMKEFYEQFYEILTKAENNIGKVELPVEETDIKCEKCGRNMVIKMGRYGKFLACPGFPDCRNAKPLLEEAGVLCPKCGGKVLIKKTKKGKKYLGCENNPNCDFMKWDMHSDKKCEKCGSFMTKKFKGKMIEYKCSNDNCGHTFEEARNDKK